MELKPDQMASLVFENEPYSGLRIRKVDAETGEGLSGALFSIHVKDGDLVGEALTDVNGLIIRENLPEGWYTVTEQQPPEGYLLDTPVRDVYVRPEEDVEVVFRDFKRPELLIKKEDAKTGAPLPGAVFRVARRDSAEYTEVTTNSDGTVCHGFYEFSAKVPLRHGFTCIYSICFIDDFHFATSIFWFPNLYCDYILPCIRSIYKSVYCTMFRFYLWRLYGIFARLTITIHTPYN